MSNRKQRRVAERKARSNPGARRTSEATASALTSALRFYQVRRFADAERICERHLTIHPRDPKAIYLLGMIAVETGRLDRAESCFVEALAQSPNQAAFHNGLALPWARQERFAEALACHERALALEPQNVGAIVGRAQALAALGDFIAAEWTLRAAADLAPGSPVIAHLHASVLGSLHRHAEAASVYRALIAIAPADAEAHLGLAHALAEQGRLKEAATSCERSLTLDPDLSNARLTLVGLLCDLRSASEAWSCAVAGIQREHAATEARAAFARALACAMPDRYDPDAVSGLECCFAAGDVDPDELTKPAANQLRAKYGLDASPAEAGAEAVEQLLRDGRLPAVFSD